MKKHLNEQIIAALKHGPTYIVWDALPTFGIRVGKRSKTFVLKKANRYQVIGPYPAITLKQARDEAKRRIASKYLPQTSQMAPEAAKTYLQAIRSEKRPATHEAYSIYLRRLPAKPLSNITAAELYNALPEGKSAANLCFSTFKAFFSWCAERDLMPANPLLKKKQPNKLKSRDRLLTDEEVRLIWKETFNHAAFGTTVRLLLLSGQRLNQIASLQIQWLQKDILVFPPYIMKSGTEHQIPLLPLVEKELSSLPFPKLNISLCTKKFREALPQIPDWRLHDARRYLSSTMAKLGVKQEVVERILAHKTGGAISAIAQIYNRHSYENEMRAAFELYEEHLQRILQPNRT